MSDPLYSPPQSSQYGAAAQPPTESEKKALKKRYGGLNMLSLSLGAIGIVLQVMGGLLVIPGLLIFMIGLVFYAKMRGLSPAWALLGLLSIIGLLIMYFLPKLCGHCDTKNSYRKKACDRCGAPLPS